MKYVPLAVLAVFVVERLLSDFIKKREAEKWFAGQVSGFLSCLILSDICNEFDAEEIRKIIQKEVHLKPGRICCDVDLILDCARRYAQTTENKNLLVFCDNHAIFAHKLPYYFQ